MAKEEGVAFQLPNAYANIELPKNSAMGPVIAAIGFAVAFGLVWHIWWMVILFFVVAVVTVIVRGFARDTTRIVTADEVRQEHRRWLSAVAATTAVSRAQECGPANAGLALHRADGVVP
jgi:cytochrome o ubiquinol oxidase subunit 1